MKRLTLIDLDSIVYIVAYNERNTDDNKFGIIKVQERTEEFIKSIITNTSAECVLAFYQILGHKNFRKNIFPGYKSKRPPAPDYIRMWRDTIHNTFDNINGTFGLKVIESDDALSIATEKYRKNYIVTLAHIDKDLNNIYGEHYNYNSQKHYSISKEEAIQLFKCQVISGDSSDGVPGCKGFGPKKAASILEEHETVIRAYKAASKKAKADTWMRNFYRDYHCIRLLKHINELKRFSSIKEVEFTPYCYSTDVDIPIIGW